jgi:hypothetical protein
MVAFAQVASWVPQPVGTFLEEKISFFFCRDSKPGPSSLSSSRYTDYVTTL